MSTFWLLTSGAECQLIRMSTFCLTQPWKLLLLFQCLAVKYLSITIIQKLGNYNYTCCSEREHSLTQYRRGILNQKITLYPTRKPLVIYCEMPNCWWDLPNSGLADKVQTSTQKLITEWKAIFPVIGTFFSRSSIWYTGYELSYFISLACK